MNMFKKNGGFTLVELIVVIAILAILAAVAVPAYNGYIGKANDAADTTVLAAIKTAAQGTFAAKGAVQKIEVTASAGKISDVTVYVDAIKTDAGMTAQNVYASSKFDKTNFADFALFMSDTMPELKGGFKDGKSVWVVAKDDTAKLAAGWNKPASE